MLSSIHSPKDVKQIPKSQLSELSEEIRKKILHTVAKNGGHLASNLGVVELTVALHRVFSSPRDAIVFDVSHQSYAHKLLTGRYELFDTLRKHGGISGFTRTQESEHDFFDNGHSSASLSQALGLLAAWELQERKGKVVAVIGDGALTGGMAFEALCHAGQLSKNLIVVLNDNQMSISPNNGSLSRYLSRLTMTRTYQSFRTRIDHLVDRIPNSERHLGKFISRVKRAFKGFLLSNNLFSDLGFEYVGPLDGHNIAEMEEVFKRVRNLSKPVVVHVRTIKGKGYSPAENDPATFHGIGPFQISDGTFEKFDTLSFTECFSRYIITAAEKNPKIVAITAAMAKGTGLDAFSRRFTDRFFDVGIAEEHAVTFAGGLAAGGMLPVTAIYSTFMQRSVDQIIHDVALSSRPVLLCLDRAGVVPSDGETHQGLFDIALLRPVPGLTL
ncbi:MAG: 1-deoxy-D-xylulose-5-phosphate synthase, partial [Treponema sp.]|nr:1-deoxy-D-xylulose-5-phosphate synthase [Treponema sp.]